MGQTRNLIISIVVLLCAACSSSSSRLALSSAGKAPGSGARSAFLASRGYTPLPLAKPSSSDKRPGIRVAVNGKKTTLLLDSGANKTRLSGSLASRSNISVDRSNSLSSIGASGRGVNVFRGNGSLTIGPRTLDRFEYTISSLEIRSTAAGSFPGHVGSGALDRSNTLIDLGSLTAWVAPNGQGALGRQATLGQPRPLLRSTTYRHLILTGTINGQPVKFIVDTGAEISLVTRSCANRLGLAVTDSRRTMLDSVGDHTPLGHSRANAVTFGSYVARDLKLAVAQIAALDSPRLRAPDGSKIDGILGIEFLRRHNALIDTRSGVIYLGK